MCKGHDYSRCNRKNTHGLIYIIISSLIYRYVGTEDGWKAQDNLNLIFLRVGPSLIKKILYRYF